MVLTAPVPPPPRSWLETVACTTTGTSTGDTVVRCHCTNVYYIMTEMTTEAGQHDKLAPPFYPAAHYVAGRTVELRGSCDNTVQANTCQVCSCRQHSTPVQQVTGDIHAKTLVEFPVESRS